MPNSMKLKSVTCALDFLNTTHPAAAFLAFFGILTPALKGARNTLEEAVSNRSVRVVKWTRGDGKERGWCVFDAERPASRLLANFSDGNRLLPPRVLEKLTTQTKQFFPY